MTILELEKRINSLCTHVLFDYKGHSCGIDPLALDDFDMWCGESYMRAKNIDEVINSPFFEGKSLCNIINEIENLE